MEQEAERMGSYNKTHLRNIKRIFQEKTGAVLEKENAPVRSVRRAVVLAAVLAGVAAMTCCAAAATFDAGALFGLLFGQRQEGPLSDGQGQYVDERAADVGEQVEQNGVSVTLTGAVSDGVMAYLWLDIAAPEGVALEQLPLAFDVELIGLRQAGQEQDSISGISTSCIALPDHDGLENTTSMLVSCHIYQPLGSGFSFNDGRTRTVHLKELFYHSDTYPYEKRTVADGVWTYDFAFTAVEEREAELLTAPLQASYCQISGREVEATVFSLRARGLSAVVYYELPSDAVQEAGDFGILTVVRKDGSTIHGYPEKAGQTVQMEGGELVPGSGCHYCAYVFDAPLCHEDIAALHMDGRVVDIALP